VKVVWPTSGSCSVLLTTRDFSVATGLASQYLQVAPLGEEHGSALLLQMTGLKTPSASDSEDALAISRAFGGLPLALTQVGSFIAQRKMALHDFLPLYEKYSSKIDCRKTPGSDYEYTLSTVWDVSFGKLPEESTRLLSVLSFLDPDGISEDILSEGSEGLGDDFAFLADEME